MKRIWIFLMAMLSIVSFIGCDMTEEHSGPVTVTDYDNLFDGTYTINNDGCCVLKGLKPLSAADIENKVKGYGWKVIGMYKVQDNGRISQTDYRKTVDNCGYVDYWFEPDGHLIGFHHGDTDGKFYNKTEWFYDAVTGFIMRGLASQSIIRKTKCYRFTKRNVPKRKTKRLRYRCPPEPYSNSVRTDFFSYSNAIILENQQINTSI